MTSARPSRNVISKGVDMLKRETGPVAPCPSYGILSEPSVPASSMRALPGASPVSLNLFSWNVNGLRAVLKKGTFQDFLAKYNPDVLCLQETKAQRDQVAFDSPDYKEYWNSARRKGYAGTAIFVKNDISVLRTYSDFEKYPDLEVTGDEFGEPMNEGRVLTIELEDLHVVTVYVPNSKNALERLKLREKSWDPTLREYLSRLQKEKPVAVCGDFNAAHEEIDIARPKTNHHSAGFTDEEAVVVVVAVAFDKELLT